MASGARALLGSFLGAPSKGGAAAAGATAWGGLLRYEARRRPATTLLLLESRFLGALETQRGAPGGWLRNAFFAATGALGVAARVFAQGAVPRVPEATSAPEATTPRSGRRTAGEG